MTNFSLNSAIFLKLHQIVQGIPWTSAEGEKERSRKRERETGRSREKERNVRKREQGPQYTPYILNILPLVTTMIYSFTLHIGNASLHCWHLGRIVLASTAHSSASSLAQTSFEPPPKQTSHWSPLSGLYSG